MKHTKLVYFTGNKNIRSMLTYISSFPMNFIGGWHREYFETFKTFYSNGDVDYVTYFNKGNQEGESLTYEYD